MLIVKLRPETIADEKLLRTLYASSRADEMAFLPWSVEQKTVFLDRQFDLQRKHFQEIYPNADFAIILVENNPAGRWYLYRGSQVIHIIDISLLPEYRNKGVGSNLLKSLMTEARINQKSVRLNVESANRAVRLYQRLGFIASEECGIHQLMEWKA
jgi:ribosomal protein S18 acetylase RimI-like enzyme